VQASRAGVNPLRRHVDRLLAARDDRLVVPTPKADGLDPKHVDGRNDLWWKWKPHPFMLTC
jgi:hypothetical protein